MALACGVEPRRALRATQRFGTLCSCQRQGDCMVVGSCLKGKPTLCIF